jgi:hypothetical protein
MKKLREEKRIIGERPKLYSKGRHEDERSNGYLEDLRRRYKGYDR